MQKTFQFLQRQFTQINKNRFGSLLKDRVKELLPIKQKELATIKEKFGDKVIGSYTVEQVIGGMRGIKGLFQDISSVDPFAGVLFRGFTIPQLKEFLPNVQKDGEPLPEGVYWLLQTGEVPNEKQLQSVRNEWIQRGALNDDVINFILSLPRTIHPMTMLSMAVLFLQKESHFAKAYKEGKTNKKIHWEFFFEDSYDLTAKLPRLAAVIYRHLYHNGDIIQSNDKLDWAGNYGHMMGFKDETMKECLRGYLSIHSDHEGGNVSAHATHLVGSALGDTYLSFSAGLNGLAGPLHGLANQEVLAWMLQFVEKSGGDANKITDTMISDYVHEVVKSGKVIPGYGHAVLREIDPRFTHQYEFSKKYIPKEPLIRLLHRCADIIPHTLKNYPKIKSPFPNVDAHSGVLLYSLGLKEYEYYTVVFAVSRALGVSTWLLWDRIYGLPIERPGSVDLKWLHNKFK